LGGLSLLTALICLLSTIFRQFARARLFLPLRSSQAGARCRSSVRGSVALRELPRLLARRRRRVGLPRPRTALWYITQGRRRAEVGRHSSLNSAEAMAQRRHDRPNVSLLYQIQKCGIESPALPGVCLSVQFNPGWNRREGPRDKHLCRLKALARWPRTTDLFCSSPKRSIQTSEHRSAAN
jgi:hypothetical protein